MKTETKYNIGDVIEDVDGVMMKVEMITIEFKKGDDAPFISYLDGNEETAIAEADVVSTYIPKPAPKPTPRGKKNEATSNAVPSTPTK